MNSPAHFYNTFRFWQSLLINFHSPFFLCVALPRLPVGTYPHSGRPHLPELLPIRMAVSESHHEQKWHVTFRGGTWWRCCKQWTWLWRRLIFKGNILFPSYLQQNQTLPPSSTLHSILQLTLAIVFTTFYCHYMFVLSSPLP